VAGISGQIKKKGGLIMNTITVTIKRMSVETWRLAKSLAALKGVTIAEFIQSLITKESK